MNIQETAIAVLGGASGLGAAIALHLASQGAKVMVIDLNQAAATEVASLCQGWSSVADVRDEVALRQAFSMVEQHCGPLRVVINCVGIIHAKRLLGKQGVMPLAEFQKVIDINLIGAFNALRLGAEAISQVPLKSGSEERGVIIQIASIAAFEGQLGQCAYSASKGGIVSMILPAARELAPLGIRVVAIAPGLMDTPMLASVTPEYLAKLKASTLFPKRLGKPQECAQLVAHIIENSYINGSVIRLDGGMRLQAE